MHFRINTGPRLQICNPAHPEGVNLSKLAGFKTTGRGGRGLLQLNLLRASQLFTPAAQAAAFLDPLGLLVIKCRDFPGLVWKRGGVESSSSPPPVRCHQSDARGGHVGAPGQGGSFASCQRAVRLNGFGRLCREGKQPQAAVGRGRAALPPSPTPPSRPSARRPHEIAAFCAAAPPQGVCALQQISRARRRGAPTYKRRLDGGSGLPTRPGASSPSGA